MEKINHFPASQALNEYAEFTCSMYNLHMDIVVHGTWADNANGFLNRSISDVTTVCRVVRAWSHNGTAHWTLETWTHGNGYSCELTVLSKDEFLSLINS